MELLRMAEILMLPNNRATRVSAILTMVITLPIVVFAQAEQLDNEHTIRQVMAQAYQQTYTSTAQKQMRRLGDATAVALTKVIGGRILDQHDVEPILLMLDLSFSDLRFVENPPDREPRTTLVLLNYLDLVTSDATLKGKITSTRASVISQFEKSEKQRDVSPSLQPR